MFTTVWWYLHGRAKSASFPHKVSDWRDLDEGKPHDGLLESKKYSWWWRRKVGPTFVVDRVTRWCSCQGWVWMWVTRQKSRSVPRRCRNWGSERCPVIIMWPTFFQCHREIQLVLFYHIIPINWWNKMIHWGKYLSSGSNIVSHLPRRIAPVPTVVTTHTRDSQCTCTGVSHAYLDSY